MRRASTVCLAFLLSLALLPSLSTPAAELAGVALDDTVEVGDRSLALNGLGLRKKTFIKVYVGGLYLESKSSDAAGILAEDEARRMVMHFLYGLSAKRLCGGWNDGLKANVPGAGAAVKEEFETLCGYMEEVGKGDRLSFTYVPGSGTEITVKGAVKGKVAGKDFADALLACWLGPEPPSADFKEGLLGK